MNAISLDVGSIFLEVEMSLMEDLNKELYNI
jgi:hypothetical protein